MLLCGVDNKAQSKNRKKIEKEKTAAERGIFTPSLSVFSVLHFGGYSLRRPFCFAKKIHTIFRRRHKRGLEHTTGETHCRRKRITGNETAKYKKGIQR